MSHQTNTKPNKNVGGVRIWLAYTATILVCIAYLIIVVLNTANELMSFKKYAALIFALYAFIMLFFVDRRKWAAKHEGHRSAINLGLVITPLLGELFETWERSIKSMLLSNPGLIEILFGLSIISFVVAFVMLLTKVK